MEEPLALLGQLTLLLACLFEELAQLLIIRRVASPGAAKPTA